MYIASGMELAGGRRRRHRMDRINPDPDTIDPEFPSLDQSASEGSNNDSVDAEFEDDEVEDDEVEDDKTDTDNT
jgi:hypothetical protein